MKTTRVYALCIAILALTITVFAQTPPIPTTGGGGSVVPILINPVTELTSEEIADGFARESTVYWQGSYKFIGNSNRIEANFTLQLKSGRWAITQLRIGDKEVPIDPNYPLWEIPSYAGTVTEFSLWMDGYSQGGQDVRRGHFYKDNLLPQDEIRILMELSNVYASIPFTFFGDHTEQNTSIVSSNGDEDSGWYDSRIGAFVVGYDPLRPPTSFNIVDLRDNSVIATVPLNDIGHPSVDKGNGLSLAIPGGTLEAYVNQGDWRTGFSNIGLDQVVERGGNKFYAKIALLHASNADYIQVFAYGVREGSWLEVYGTTTDGQMKFLGQSNATNDLVYTLVVGDLSGYKSYKAVIIGATLNPVYGASLQFYRSDYPWGDGLGR